MNNQSAWDMAEKQVNIIADIQDAIGKCLIVDYMHMLERKHGVETTITVRTDGEGTHLEITSTCDEHKEKGIANMSRLN